MELEPLRVQVTRYCYNAIVGFGEYKYKLHSIKRSEQVLNYPVENIEKVSPSAQGLKQLSLFNKLYIPHCNSIAIQFAFTDPDASESVFSLVFWLPLFWLCCLPSQNRVWQGEKLWRVYEPSPMPIVALEWNNIKSSDLSHSVFSILHNLIETNNGFFHVGISLLPACGFFIPFWLSTASMLKCLLDWSTIKIPCALHCSFVTVKYKTGDVNIYSTRGFHTSMQLRDYRPWLEPCMG